LPVDEKAKLRVLAIAEACNPQWSSVPLVGFSFVRALASRSDLELTLITQVRNRDALLADPISGQVAIHFVDNDTVARPLFRLSQFLRGGTGLSWTTATALSWPGYMAFERIVAKTFGGALRRGEYDLIHRITPLTPTLGSPLASRTNVPMLIGPLNGGLPWPKEFPELRRQEREWLVPLRGIYRHMPYYRSTYKHAAGVIAGSKSTAKEVPAYFRGLRYYLPENGIDPERFPVDVQPAEAGSRFRFVTVGRLVPYKGMDLILRALAGYPRLCDSDLTIIGDGPQRSSLEALARELGLEHRVRFLGWLTQSEVARELSLSQAFVFPSLREFGGGVVLEAMAMGLPPIVVDYGGPGELVTPDCGVLVPLVSREKLIPALASAMETVATDPALRHCLGQSARKRVLEEFTWDVKARKLVDIYRDVLSRTNGRA
jgi:glycosyltransferase involved in cell wall biosynthesis